MRVLRVFRLRIRKVVVSMAMMVMLCTAALPSLGASEGRSPQDSVTAVIRALQSHWNRGDMDAYLALYQQDDSLALTFGNTVVEGWAALDSLFRQSYPDHERMGRFTVDRLHVLMLDADTGVAYGNFTHVFPSETIKGGFSHVIVRGEDGLWRIRHERTSRGEVIASHGAGEE